jgi:hypothetical protein
MITAVLVLAGLVVAAKAIGGLWWLLLGHVVHERPRGARRARR